MSHKEEVTTNPIDEFAMRREKRLDLISKNINPYPNYFKKELSLSEVRSQSSKVEKDAPSGLIFVTAGRIIAKRGHGKASFANLLDDSGTLQLYFKQDIIGEEKYDLSRTLDLGDFLGITGEPFITHTGELTLKVLDFTLLAKSLNPLPEKFHGLHDKELRYRKRHLDLIANPDVKKVFQNRSKIISLLRRHLENEGFMEVETPVLQTIPGGASAKPFNTHHNALEMELHLRISLELPLKRLIVGGFEKVFEIGRVFRNEGISYKHNPEYTLMELYQAYADYNDMMTLTENVLSSLAKEITGSFKVEYGDTVLDFTPPFKRITMTDAIKTHTNIDISKHDFASLKKEIAKLKINLDETYTSSGQLVNFLYDEFVEKHLIQPTFITDYPIETSPLAKTHRSLPGMVERFELIINTLEVANAYTELNDPVDQKGRFMEQAKQREAGDEEAHMMDTDFVEALEYGMPPTGGLGIGIDRVVMLLTNAQSIRDVLLFPHMKNKPTVNE